MSTRIVHQGVEYATGFKRALVDHRDVLYSAVAPTKVALPTRYDIEETKPLPVYDQGQYPACVGWTNALVKSYQEFKECGTMFRFDGLKIYNLAGGGDGGITMRQGCETVRTIGAPKGKDFFKYQAYAGINPKAHDQVRHAVFTQGVLLVGFNVPASFMDGGGKEFKDVGAQGDEIVGGHAIGLVGYEAEGPILHNSWGRSWGKKGRTVVSWAWWDKYVDECWSAVDLRDSSVARRFARVRKGALT